jgi:hypothetical protein
MLSRCCSGSPAAVADVHLERERFDVLCEIPDPRFLYQNRIKTDLIEPSGVVG